MLASLADAGIPSSLDLPIAVVAVGDAAWVHLPVELFASFGLAIRERSPFPWTRVIGYTNGYYGYVADEAAHRDGVYEASASRFDAAGGQILALAPDAWWSHALRADMASHQHNWADAETSARAAYDAAPASEVEAAM